MVFFLQARVQLFVDNRLVLKKIGQNPWRSSGARCGRGCGLGSGRVLCYCARRGLVMMARFAGD